MFIPLPILIIALVIFCLLLWSNSKNSPKKTILDLDSTLMGTMTVSQAYHIASCYGDSIVKLSEAQKRLPMKKAGGRFAPQHTNLGIFPIPHLK